MARKSTRQTAEKQVATGMANPVRTAIQVLLNERAASATEVWRELAPRFPKLKFDKVSYEMKMLREAGLISRVATRQVRGAVQTFYRAEPACIDREEWRSVPPTLRGSMRGSLLDTVTSDAVDAVSNDTYDSLDGAHMSWMPLLADTQGWEELVSLLRRTLEEAFAIKDGCTERLAASEDPGIPVTISMLGYPSAGEPRTVGPPEDDDASS